MRWTFAFYLVPNTNFRIRMLSVSSAIARGPPFKTEPLFTQRIRATSACPKMPIDMVSMQTWFISGRIKNVLVSWIYV